MQGVYDSLSQDQVDFYSDINAGFMKTVEIFGSKVSWANFSMSLGLPCIFGYYRIYLVSKISRSNCIDQI